MWELVAAERRRLADELEALSEEQWETPSQCDAWTVRQVAAHLVMPFEVPMWKFFVEMARHRFDFDRVAVKLSNEIAAKRTTGEIIATLRDNADSRWTPPAPGLGVETVLVEVVVHGQDIRNAVGIECSVPDDTVEQALAAVKSDDVRADYRRRVDGA